MSTPNTPAHTPAPWQLKGIKRKGRMNWHISGLNSAGIPSPIAVVHDLAPDHDCPTQEANATLIASAPELLEALALLSEVYDAMGAPRGPARIVAEAAIGKAIGNESIKL